MARWHLSLMCAAAMAAGSVGTVAAQDPPLKATFRCANSGACPAAGPADGIQADGVVEGIGPYTFDGYKVFTVGTGKKGVTYIDGAYLNPNGGISIQLVPGGPGQERSLQLRFSGRQVDLPGTEPSACNVDGQMLSATDVDFRFNIIRPDGSGGIETIPAGSTIGPSNPGTDTVIGIVNFKTAAIEGSLYFNYSQDDTVPWDGEVTLTRVDDLLDNKWILTSTSTVLFQCKTGGKGKVTKPYNVGTYHMPFQLTVLR